MRRQRTNENSASAPSNVHALRNQWTIQFDQFPLYEAGLFAITGPTGGGKSSLLDTMIVALMAAFPGMDTTHRRS